MSGAIHVRLGSGDKMYEYGRPLPEGLDVESLFKALTKFIDEFRPDEYAVVLMKLGERVIGGPSSKIEAVKVIRTIASMSIKDAKDLADQVGYRGEAGNEVKLPLRTQDPIEAKRWVKMLRNVGCEAEVCVADPR